MSSITMAADSTQSEYSRKMLKMNEKSVKKRRKRYSTPSRSRSSTSSSSSNDDSGSDSSSDRSSASSSYEKRKKDFQKKSSKSSRNSKRTSSASESDSDLDLKKNLLPIVGYMKNKKMMVDNMFKSISSKKLKTMLPEILKSISLSELKSMCSEQLEVMSDNRISKILQGTDPSEISSTDSEDDGSGGNTSAVNESQQSSAQLPTREQITEQLPQSKSQNQSNTQRQIKSSPNAIDKTQLVQSHQDLPNKNIDIKTDETITKSTTIVLPNNTTASITSNPTSNISRTSHDLNALDEDELDYDEEEEEEVAEDTKGTTINSLKQRQSYEFNNNVAELFVDTINDDFNDEDDKDDIEDMKGSKEVCENDDVKTDKSAVVEKVSDSVPVKSEKTSIKLVRNKTSNVDKNTSLQIKPPTTKSSLVKTSASDQLIQQSLKVPVTKVSPSTSSLPSAKTEPGNKNNNDKGLDKTQLEILELEMRARAIKAMLKAQEELELQMQQKANKQQSRRSVDKQQQQQHAKRKDVEMSERNNKKRDGDAKEKSPLRLHYDDNEVKYTRKVCRLPTPEEVLDVPVKRLMTRRVSSPPTHRRYQDDDMRTLPYDLQEYDRRRSDYVDHYHDDYEHEQYHSSRYRQHHQDYDYHHYSPNFRRPRVVYMPPHDDGDKRILPRYDNFEDSFDYDYRDDYRSHDRSRSYRNKPDYLVVRRSRDDDDQFDDRKPIRK